MHPDRKIGIAMGILLIGVVGALFFRNEPLDQQTSFGMRREQELNERLKERDVAVYFEDGQPVGSETDEVDEVERQLQKLMQTDLYPDDPQPQHDNHADPPPVAATPPAISHDGVLIDPSGQLRPARPLRHPTPRPADSESKTLNAVSALPALSDTGSSTGLSDSTSEPIVSDARPPDSASTDRPQYEEYTVQFGDTLSEIAERFLGSQARYRDIYEANRDRMASPDQLKVGKAIRIPRVYR